MLIVFEGPDNAGKSTLATAVQRRLNAALIHHGPPVPNGALTQWGRSIALASEQSPVVIDRLHWGDPVYAPIYRPEVGEQLSVTEFTALNRAIDENNGFIVYVTASVEKLTERFDGEYIQTDDLGRICEAYEDCVALSSPFVHVYQIDTTRGFQDFDLWVDRILERAVSK